MHSFVLRWLGVEKVEKERRGWLLKDYFKSDFKSEMYKNEELNSRDSQSTPFLMLNKRVLRERKKNNKQQLNSLWNKPGVEYAGITQNINDAQEIKS